MSQESSYHIHLPWNSTSYNSAQLCSSSVHLLHAGLKQAYIPSTPLFARLCNDSVYPTQRLTTIAKRVQTLIKRSTKDLQRLNETLKNAGLHENFCACSKKKIRTIVLRRSPTITAFTSFHTTLFWRYTSDHGRLPTFPLTS